MPNLVPYIYFADESLDAVEFYKGVFGGDADVQVEGARVVHLEFRAGDVHFMGSDLSGDDTDVPTKGGYGLVLNCDSEDQLRDFHSNLVEGGTEVFALVDGGWGAIVAHCVDRFGVTWMLNFDVPQG
jgi:PhnB protein